jgi:hypothetical protein
MKTEIQKVTDKLCELKHCLVAGGNRLVDLQDNEKLQKEVGEMKMEIESTKNYSVRHVCV